MSRVEVYVLLMGAAYVVVLAIAMWV